jgi:hypothetical protein
LEAMMLMEKLDVYDATRNGSVWSNGKPYGLADLSYKVLETKLLDPKLKKATKVTVDVKLNGSHWANGKCSLNFMGDWNVKK